MTAHGKRMAIGNRSPRPKPHLARLPAMRTARLCLGALGGYAFTDGYIAFTGAILTRIGLARGEAAFFALFTGLIVFVAVFIWAAATRRFIRTALAVIIVAGAFKVSAPYMVL